jgi:hypothetical protein
VERGTRIAPVISDGRADFSGAIGSGIDWNETAIARRAP